MDLHHMPDPVSGPVRVIEPDRPHRRTRQRVDLLACRPLREARRRHRDMAAKHGGEGGDHLGIRRADGDCAGDVGGAVIVMGAGIDKKQAVLDKREVPAGKGAVMHDGAVRAGPADGLEA